MKYSSKEKIIVYAGVSAHVCPQRGFIDVVQKGVVGMSIGRCFHDFQMLRLFPAVRVAHVVNVQSGEGGPETTAPAFSNIPLVSSIQSTNE